MWHPRRHESPASVHYSAHNSPSLKLGVIEISTVQPAKRMRRVILSRVLSDYNIFPHSLTNGTNFGKIYWLNTKCVFWFSLQISSTTFPILKSNQLDNVINVKTSSCKVPVILGKLYCNLNFLNRFSKKARISNFIKIRPVAAELFHAEEMTDIFAILQTRLKKFLLPAIVRLHTLLVLSHYFKRRYIFFKKGKSCP